MQLWLRSAGEALLLVPFVLIMFDKHKVQYRKILYYVYLIVTICMVLYYVLIIFVFAIRPTYVTEALAEECTNN